MMSWAPNSPDLSAIEPLWWYLKYKTLRKKRLGKKALRQAWIDAWKELTPDCLQRYITRVRKNVKWVLI